MRGQSGWTFCVLVVAVGCSESTVSSLPATQCASDSDCEADQWCAQGYCNASAMDGIVNDAGTADNNGSTTADASSIGTDTNNSELCQPGCRMGESCVAGVCVCSEGFERACGNKIGECRYGVEVCTDGSWSSCEGGVQPVDELCDNRDNDCDGAVDEGVLLELYADGDNDGFGNAETRVEGCEESEGQSRRPGDCDDTEPSIHPEAPEICDGRDNNCNALTDTADPELQPAPEGQCGSAGVCATSSPTCEGAAGWRCPPPDGLEDDETLCDGDDNDCDGMIDEGLLNACGDCGETPVEVCDSEDNDCDGMIDEALTRSCSTACGDGMELCQGGGWVGCSATQPTAEVCDGEDNDCDGMIDEALTRSCSTACGDGMELCQDGGWVDCSAPQPEVEICDGLDNDCVAGIDDGGVCQAPRVTCPPGRTLAVNETALLTGSGSDPDGGPVSYGWRISTRPAGSSASVLPPDQATTSFTAGNEGSYTVELCVEDDEEDQACCEVALEVSSPCTPPQGPGLVGCGVSWDRRPIVEFRPVPAGIVYTLVADGSDTPYATIDTPGHNHHRPSAELGAGGPPPMGQTVQVTAQACRADSPSCCSPPESLEVALIASCSTTMPPSPDNVIISEYLINGGGPCPGGACEAGEAVELTNLSNCPVSLQGHHFRYCSNASCSTYRYTDFGAGDIIPPRGVYVTIRNLGSATAYCDFPYLGAEDPGLFGLTISDLTLTGNQNDESGWFRNSGGGSLRLASGPFNPAQPTSGTLITEVANYQGGSNCSSIGFNAINTCADEVEPGTLPTDQLSQNQLGQLSQPCDEVVNPIPMCSP